MTDEHKEVAAIICIDIDILARMAENENYTADDLRSFIKMTKDKKDKAISDPEGRTRRYNAMCNVMAVARNK